MSKQKRPFTIIGKYGKKLHILHMWATTARLAAQDASQKLRDLGHDYGYSGHDLAVLRGHQKLYPGDYYGKDITTHYEKGK